MSSGDFDISYVAHLARIDLTPGEQERLGAQLSQILGYVDKLKEVNVDGVEPTAHAFPMVNVFRKDEATPSIPHEDAMRNAPSKNNGLFVVPKIVE